MDQKTFRKCILIIVGILIASAALVGIKDYPPIILIVSGGLGFMLIEVCRRKLNEGTEDKQINRIEGKAAKWTLIIFLIGASIGSIYFSSTKLGVVLANLVNITIILLIAFRFYHKIRI